MLVLSRKLGQVVVVPECELKVTVLSVQGNTAGFATTVPDEIDLYREEIWQRMNQETERRLAKE